MPKNLLKLTDNDIDESDIQTVQHEDKHFRWLDIHRLCKCMFALPRIEITTFHINCPTFPLNAD